MNRKWGGAQSDPAPRLSLARAPSAEIGRTLKIACPDRGFEAHAKAPFAEATCCRFSIPRKIAARAGWQKRHDGLWRILPCGTPKLSADWAAVPWFLHDDER